MSSHMQISGDHTPVDDEAIQQLVDRVHGQVITQVDPSYNEARAVWNGMIDRRPSIIVRCSGTADVVESVTFARENNMSIAVRGGGHNVAGNAVADDALVVDLSNMRGIHVDPAERTVRVQGGATWAEVDRETQVFGLATPGGAVSPTGVAGLTLHGGIGHLRRKYGLSLDNLLSVEIVTADGTIRTASASENPELFWAVRGAGSNFGVVTSLEFRLHPVGPEIFLCAPLYPAEEAGNILPQWRDFMESAPEEISSIAIFWSVPDGFPEEHVGKEILILAAIHCGPPEEGEQATMPLRQMGEPILDLSATEPYTAAQSGFDPFFPNGGLYYWKSLFTNDLSDEVITQLCELAAIRPSPLTTLEIWHHGGAMHRVPVDATAYASRQSRYMLAFESGWTDPAENERNVTWSREAWSQMFDQSAGSIYLNFPGFGEDQHSMVRAAYGPNYERLAHLKAIYDPDNRFCHNQNIVPATSARSGI